MHRGLVEQAQVDAHAPIEQVRRGVERVTAVVARADQAEHDIAGRYQVEVIGQPARGPLHQLTVRKRRSKRLLGGTDVADGVGTQHSATTKAVATLVSWEIDRWAVVMPSS